MPTVKSMLFALAMAIASATLGLAPTDAEARRLGGARPSGMQRAVPPAKAPPAAAPTNAATAPAAAPKRNWMGPLAGLAAGLGLAALFSHLGMGEGLANVVMMVLLAIVAFAAIRFLMRRLAGGQQGSGPQLAGAGAPAGGWQAQPEAQAPPLQRQAVDAAPLAAGAAQPAAVTLPGGMAAGDFERLAKMVFIRMQAANDAGNVDDLRKFTTPELFASLRLDLQERGAVGQQTDVVQIDAQVVDTAREDGQDIVSVRFQGLIRETAESGAEPFNEVWHLVRPVDGGGDWAIAGITPIQ